MTESPIVALVIVIFVVIFSSRSSNAGSPAVFILGDSLLDIGTNNYVLQAIGKAKYPHYGVDFFNSTPSGRFTNGLNLADYIARVVFGVSVTSPPAYLSLFYFGKYSEKKLINASNFDPRRRWRPPTRDLDSVSRENPATGINFASSGTAILDINSAVDQALPITEQTAQLMFVHGNLTAEIGSWKTQFLFGKSPFFIAIGNNDVHFFALARAKLDPDAYVDRLVQAYNNTLRTLYNIGARKFGVFGVPYVGCSPLMRVTIRDGNCSKTANDLAMQFNAKLEQLLWDMMHHYRGMIYSFADSYELFRDFYENPERYNFKNVNDACCGLGRFNAMSNCLPVAKLCNNRDEYLFWDVSHPSSYAIKLMVQTFASGNLTFVRPINWDRLVSL